MPSAPFEHIPGAHPGGQQGLVGVPHGGVGDQQLLLVQHPLLDGLGALLIQNLFQAVLGYLPAGLGNRGVSYCLRSAFGVPT